MAERSKQSDPVVIAYKGFDSNLACRGYQFEVGKTYEHTGAVKACSSGFHACENPLDVFSYYAPSTSRFCAVELSGELSRHDEDSKIAAAKIKLTAELKLPDLIALAIKSVFSACKPSDIRHATGDWSASSATGDRSASSATGHQSASSVDGIGAVAMSIGRLSKSKASKGGAIVCVYRDQVWNLVHIRASKVGENGIEPDVYYTLNAAGEFVAA